MIESWHRRAAYITAAVQVGDKNLKMDKLWPVSGEKKSTGLERAKKTMEKFREVEALQRAKNKLNG